MKKISFKDLFFIFLLFSIGSCNNEEEMPAPVINSFSPTEFSLAAGETEILSITGTNFGTSKSEITVTMSGIELEVQSVTNTLITAKVTSDIPGGSITVSINGRIANSSQSVTVNQAPVIDDFNPKNGKPGTVVSITGSNFTKDTKVSFFENKNATVSFVSASELQATVPTDAITGKIKISDNIVEVETVTDFIVGDLPVLSTTSVSQITETTAETGGEISDDGGANITARGVCWSISEEPTIDNNKSEDGNGTGNFTSSLANLEKSTTYYIRAYATNSIGTAYGNQLTFTTLTPTTLPVVTTKAITNVTENSASIKSEISDNGGLDISEQGICWSTSADPTISDNKISANAGTSTFESNISGLAGITTYYVRAYATNNLGTAYGNQLSFTTQTKVVEVTNSVTGKTWMDRNLGASQAATSISDEKGYGHLYQWGRSADGHQNRNSETTNSLASSDVPGHSKFILNPDAPNDWQKTHNKDLWQGANGTNNPCPDGFRLPTEAEWEEERQSWSPNNADGAFGSELKVPLPGIRGAADGAITNEGTMGFYWTSTVNESNNYSKNLRIIGNNGPFFNSGGRGNGYSVRCIKD